MRIIEAPDESMIWPHEVSIFLAGSIVGCPEWQTQALGWLSGTNMDLVAINPRRQNFPINDPKAAPQQIAWEFTRLRQADVILFWFPEETLCPIVLYELGAWSMTDKPIAVGCHPSYKRRQDVVIQTALARPNIPVVHDLVTTCAHAKALAGAVWQKKRDTRTFTA